MVVPLGATPFITKRSMPKGGVVIAISMLRSISNPNHIGSKPRAKIMGIYIGTLIIIIAVALIKLPRTSRTICIAMTSTMGARGRLTTK